MPQISIITVNKDNASGLIKTVESVVSQTYTDYEWIVIDAASKDGSVDLIKQYAHHISYWVSEPDGGIYAGMNKGIMKATGEYVYFLNSGDLLVNNEVLQSIVELSLLGDVVVGKINICSDEKGIIKKDYMVPYSDITLFSLYLYGIPHQASLIKRQLFDECGLYDYTCKINADWKFFVEVLILRNKTVQHIPITIANYDATGISSVNKQQLLRDRQEVFNNIIPERIRKDYDKVFPHYYEVYRIEWLLKHPLFYKIYRMLTSFGIRCFK